MKLWFFVVSLILSTSVYASDESGSSCKPNLPLTVAAAASADSPPRTPIHQGRFPVVQEGESKSAEESSRSRVIASTLPLLPAMQFESTNLYNALRTPPNQVISRKRLRMDHIPQSTSGDGDDGTENESSDGSLKGEYNPSTPVRQSRITTRLVIGGPSAAQDSNQQANASQQQYTPLQLRVMRLSNAIVTSTAESWKAYIEEDIATHGELELPVAKYLITRCPSYQKLAILLSHCQAHLLPLSETMRGVLKSSIIKGNWITAYVIVFYYQYVTYFLHDELMSFWKALVTESMHADLIKSIDMSMPAVKREIVHRTLCMMIDQSAQLSVDQFREQMQLLSPLTLRMAHFKLLIQKLITDVHRKVCAPKKLQILFGFLQQKFRNSPFDMIHIQIYASTLGDSYRTAVTSFCTKELSDFAFENQDLVIRTISQTPSFTPQEHVLLKFVESITRGDASMKQKWLMAVIMHPDFIESGSWRFIADQLQEIRPIPDIY